MTVNQESTSKNKIVDSLKVILSQLVDENRHISLTGLVDGVEGISKATLCNIMNGDNKNPRNKTVIKIIDAINLDDNLSWDSIVSQYEDEHPELSELIEQHAKTSYRGNSSALVVKEPFSNALADDDTFRPLILSQSDDGVAVSYVEKQFGRDALVKMDKLVAKKVIIKRGGRYYAINENINFDQGDVQRLACNLINKCYDLETFKETVGLPLDQKKRNQLGVIYRTDVDLNYVLPEVCEVMEEMKDKIRAILNHPKAKGVDTFWSILSSDSLLKNQGRQSEIGRGVLQ